MLKTEFFETAVQHGFYGLDKSNLHGKKDNVRKYWEDTFIKLAMQPFVERLLNQKQKIRIVDLGCGSGEGIELLTHIPPSYTNKNFLLDLAEIEVYEGVDISPAMVEQGKRNYAGLPQVHFSQADLSQGFPLLAQEPYDIYFSSYCALPHLTPPELEQLLCQMLSHIEHGYIAFDLYGLYSPEWPGYWDKDSTTPHPYTMAYLLPPTEQIAEKVDWFEVFFWSGSALTALLDKVIKITGKNARIVTLQDRSILIGRHMDTALFKQQRHQLRYQVNRLFDRDYKGETAGLMLNLAYLDEVKASAPVAWERIMDYGKQWQTVIAMLDALEQANNGGIKRLIETTELTHDSLADDLKMLAWLYRNMDRFPVVDFWASVLGPQVACVLRNLELALPEGVGCGHALFCVLGVGDE